MISAMLRRFRRFNRRWAHSRGYFWLPCPVCGRPFGGHEGSGAAVPQRERPGFGWCVCFRKNCVEEARRQWEEALKSPAWQEVPE